MDSHGFMNHSQGGCFKKKINKICYSGGNKNPIIIRVIKKYILVHLVIILFILEIMLTFVKTNDSFNKKKNIMCIWESLGIKIPVAPINSQKGSLAEKV